MKTKLLAALAVTSLLTLNSSAQDIHFSQFYDSPLTMNPALCGMFRGDEYVGLNYKNQWGSVMGSGYGFNTIAAEAQMHTLVKKWNKSYLAPGLSFYNDKSGDGRIGVTEVCLSIGSGLYIDDKNTIAGGLQGGWAQNSMSTSNLQWGSQYDPNSSSGYDPGLPADPITGNSFSYLDFSGGIAWNYATGNTNMTSNNYFRVNAGVAVFHVNQPKDSYYNVAAPGEKLYMRWVGHAMVEYSIPNSNIGIIPAVVYYLQGPAQETDLGFRVRYILRQDSKYTGFVKGAALDVGAYYRMNDSFIPLVQMEFSSYSIGVSYDANVSSLGRFAPGTGGFEISLRFLNPNPFMSGSQTSSQSMF